MTVSSAAGSPAPRYSEPAESAVDLARRAAYVRSGAHFARPRGSDLFGRYEPLLAWATERVAAGVFPYGRALMESPSTTTVLQDAAGRQAKGINFSSQDYLSLSQHPEVVEAAVRAARDFGVHSAGSGMLAGNTRYSLDLQEQLADLVQTPYVLLFPTGWGAAFGAIAGLIRPYDHVVIDALAHASLHQGAAAATPQVHRHPHLDVEAARAKLAEIRAGDTKGAILVVTEGLFSMDSDVGRVADLLEVCREHDAFLLVDVAHDLGSLGPGGTGALGMQEVLGQVDIVMGAFSKTFASNGGFVATHSMAATTAITGYGGPFTFSNALSPIQAAVVSETLRLVRSPEGEMRRARLYRGATRLRDNLAAHGITCLGEPSAIVPVPLGSEVVGRVASGLLSERGVLANLSEYPAVAAGTARFRMQMMAGHTDEEIDLASEIVVGVVHDATALANEANLLQGPRLARPVAASSEESAESGESA